MLHVMTFLLKIVSNNCWNDVLSSDGYVLSIAQLEKFILKGKFPQTTMWIWIIHLRELICKVLYVALSRRNYFRIC